jgi:hypothetical protein
VFCWEDYYFIFIFEDGMSEVFGTSNSFEGIAKKFKSINLFTGARPYFESISKNMKHTWLKISS